MFNPDFYPTPQNVIEIMTNGIELQNKTILEPSAGSGAIVDYLQDNGSNVLACENDDRLKIIIKSKCRHIADDFLSVQSEQISHINAIIMNPPFSRGAEHLLHAYEIAPKGCEIVCLLNFETINNPFTQQRKHLNSIIDNYGNIENLGNCFTDAERKTGVEVAMVKIKKAGESHAQEFEGFFMDEEPEEKQENGIMSYNVVRDLVNRYVAACKIYSEVLSVNSRLNEATGSFFSGNIGVQITLDYPNYKKELQKSGWKFIFNKMNLTKYTTRGVREDINNFVEEQTEIPFTMKNIYVMLDIVIQTAGQRMDKAILEVFDRVTSHHHENRHNIKGWKTNSHFLVGKKFILPNMINPAKEYGYTSDTYNSLKSSYDGIIPDFEKALCYVTGQQYEEKTDDWDINKNKYKTNGILTVNTSINRNTYGEWYESHFFKYKGYKNGNMHFEFVSDEIWQKFNQRIAKLKGFELYEPKEQTKYQDKQTGRDKQEKKNPAHSYKPTVLFEI